MNREEIINVLNSKFPANFTDYVNFCFKNIHEGCDDDSELHHIIPRCVDEKYIKCDWNIIRLRYVDHIEAHILIASTYPCRQLTSPLNFMRPGKNNGLISLETKRVWEEMRQDGRYEQWCEAQSIRMKKIFGVGGDMYKHMSKMSKIRHSQEGEKEKLSEHFKEIWKSEEHRQLMRDSAKKPENILIRKRATKKAWGDMSEDDREERKNKLIRFNQSPEGRLKNSEMVKKAFQKQEVKDRHRNSIIGIRWWTDGVSSKKSRECPGEGWVLGRDKDIMQRIINKRDDKQ